MDRITLGEDNKKKFKKKELNVINFRGTRWYV